MASGVGLYRSEPGVRREGRSLAGITIRINSTLTALSAPPDLINTQGEVRGGKTESRRAHMKQVLMDRW